MKIIKVLFLLFLSTKAFSFQTIKVVDEFSFPIKNAQILIGDALNNPFIGNYLITNDLGELNTPSEWISTQNITTDASGFIRQTIYNVNPAKIQQDIYIIQLKTLRYEKLNSISGEITNLPLIEKDKLIDFAVITKSFSQNNLKDVQQGDFLSPFSDSIILFAQNVSIFSNASVPTQKEYYGLPIKIEKPIYTIMDDTKRTLDLVSLSGNFIFKTVVDELKAGKTFFDIINIFEFNQLNNTPSDFRENQFGLNISSQNVLLSDKRLLQNRFINVEETSLVIPLATQKNNDFWPVGLKKLNASEVVFIQAPRQSNLQILSFIKNTSELKFNDQFEKVSITLNSNQKFSKSSYLPIGELPQLWTAEDTFQKLITLKVISVPSDLMPTGQSVILSSTYDYQYKNQSKKMNSPKWELLSENYTDQIAIPQWPLDIIQVGQISWNRFATDANTPAEESINSIYKKLDQSNYISRSTVLVENK